MNLNAYDSIIEKLDKNKTWIDIRRKTILSREMKYRKYTCILKRYNPETNMNVYINALHENHPANRL